MIRMVPCAYGFRRQPGGREPGSEFGRYVNFAGLARLRDVEHHVLVRAWEPERFATVGPEYRELLLREERDVELARRTERDPPGAERGHEGARDRLDVGIGLAWHHDEIGVAVKLLQVRGVGVGKRKPVDRDLAFLRGGRDIEVLTARVERDAGDVRAVRSGKSRIGQPL